MSTSTPTRTLTLAIAGNPNSGKTTLFNQLTGLRQKVGNYAGVTVERKEGFFNAGGTQVRLIDLPGTYSLSPNSEEERIATELILGLQPDMPEPDGVICVVDSTSLEKSLYLILQIRETGAACMVLLNMTDELVLRGAQLDAELLGRMLEVPVIPISAREGAGLPQLRELLECWVPRPAEKRSEKKLLFPTLPEITGRRIRAKQIARSVMRKDLKAHPWSNKIDAIVMSRVWGPLIFAVIVLLVFQAIFSWAKPLMDGIDGLFTLLAGFVHRQAPDALWTSFLSDGLIAGVGSVVVFLPQVLIVFFFIALLEHSGYLARAALVMDRMLRKVGLQGKSFLPLISSYACAVPGIMATRTIENKRDRFATILIAPFMTCSARLPVYAFLISAFIPDRTIIPGLLGWRSATLLGLYALGFFAAMGTAWALQSTILKSDKTPFFLEIPPYRWPAWKTIFLMMWDRAKIFLTRAGTIILGASLALWILVTFPRHTGPDAIRDSYAGQIGRAIEPAIKPLGFNWKIGVGLLYAQIAREVMVSSLSTIYHVQNDNQDQTKLQDAVRQDVTPLTAVSLLIFFAFAMQCSSTLAVTRRETGSWKMPAAMFFYMNTLAYLASLAVFQVGRLLGF
jgi:ferrous iron transport protein B